MRELALDLFSEKACGFAGRHVGQRPDQAKNGVLLEPSDDVSVERWHAAAIRNGGTDNGAPGLRPEYSGRYYAAFRARPERQQRRSRLPRTCTGSVATTSRSF